MKNKENFNASPSVPGATLDDHRLGYIYEVIVAGGVRAAAERLGTDPSVVSRHIAQAQSTLGTKLFDRIGRQLRPTAAGQIVAEYVRERRLHQQNLHARLADLHNLRDGIVRIACSEGIMQPLIQGPVAALQTAHPDIRFRIEACSVEAMNALLLESEFDLALSHNPPFNAGVHSLYKRALAIDFIAHRDHPLCRAGQPVSIDALRSYPLALLPDGYGIRGALTKLEAEESLALDCHFVSNTLAGLLSYVAAGFAATLMPELVYRHSPRKEDLKALPLEHSLMRQAELNLLAQKGRTLSPAVEAARDAITKSMRTGFDL